MTELSPTARECPAAQATQTAHLVGLVGWDYRVEP